MGGFSSAAEPKPLILGPVFTREAGAAPRRVRMYGFRAGYPFILLALAATAWMVAAGTQTVRAAGDLARFGTLLFVILAPLQLALSVFLAAVTSANFVCQEKDRGTIALLLLTRLNNLELVAGKLAASVLGVMLLLAAAWPFFALATLLGGTTWAQLARTFAVTLAATVAAGALGCVMGFWREKTFQALALTTLVLVFWIAAWEAVGQGAFGATLAGDDARAWSTRFSPWQALWAAMQPRSGEASPEWLRDQVLQFVTIAAAVAAGLVGLACARVRHWCRDGGPRILPEEVVAADSSTERAPGSAPRATREVWDNPILWREIRTWAYGRRVVAIRIAYVVLVGLAAVALYRLGGGPQGLSRAAGAMVLAPLGLLSLFLINAQAVTALTTERDGRALDLLLVTDLSPQELIVGKLAGIAYNAKEMILLPLALGAALWMWRSISLENVVYLGGGALVLMTFVTVLGVHCGLNYHVSRQAISVSLGTVFFLFLGVATCMRIMAAFSGSFQVQLAPFVAVIGGGGVLLFLALGARNPSFALGLASMVLPFSTFYAITGLFLENTLGVLLGVAAAYGFATAAMLIPTIFEFDLAIGRTTLSND